MTTREFTDWLSVRPGMKTLNSVQAAKAATSVPAAAAPSSLEKLQKFMDTHRIKAKMGPQYFADFERDLHARVMEIERDMVAAEMARHDVDADAVVIDWSVSGAQAILTPRGWDQSERFDKAWALVAATFQTEVTVLANVIALKPQP
jgi:hypothetical protein